MTDPAGTSHTVAEGESLASIAKTNGYLWKTLWDDGRNAELRAARRNPNQLLRGDVLFLPAKGRKDIAKPVDARHRFKRRGEPTRLKLQLLDMGEPRKQVAYTLTFGDEVVHGTTDGDGRIDQPIPGETRTATLRLGDAESYEVAIGELDPVEEVTGVQHRLRNLGFDCAGEDGEVGPGTRAALQRFQRANGLEATGDADDATRAKLSELHV
ncbi:MAG TPA: peptidoglycan-binding protein [Luteimonas sp.]|nr:peptidoglycan-binding protein [Luteimonas sp.]